MSSVLSIAGLDPSGGAGLLADIKSFHQLGINGFGVATAYTYQTESKFAGLSWATEEQIVGQLQPLLDSYDIRAAKIGLIPSLEVLDMLLDLILKYQGNCKVVWDPVLKASAGFEFHSRLDPELLEKILEKTYCTTPNLDEEAALAKAVSVDSTISLKSTHVILKGGHALTDQAEDVLYKMNGDTIKHSNVRLKGKSIHGSGCVFSAVLAGSLAKGEHLEDAFRKANEYVYHLLVKSQGKLGDHHLIREM